jgi:hypothetical protein
MILAQITILFSTALILITIPEGDDLRPVLPSIKTNPVYRYFPSNLG